MTKHEMVGIIYAGGLGGRLAPFTGRWDEYKVFHPKRNKQTLPLGELGTPMFGYPLALMMRAGIRNILIPTFSNALDVVQSYYGDGSRLGIRLTYTDQFPDIKGPAQNLYAAKDLGFIQGRNVCVIYGDVSVHPEIGSNLALFFDKISSFNCGALIASMNASERDLDPRQYGVISRCRDGKVIDIDEKPQNPCSAEIHVGISIYDRTLPEKLTALQEIGPSHPDGQLRETDVSKLYARKSDLDSFCLNRTYFIDCGDRKLYTENYAYIRNQAKHGAPVDTPEIVATEMGLAVEPQHPSERIIIPTHGRQPRLGPLSRFQPIF